MLLGKGRGKSFVSNKRCEIWRAKEEDGKEMLCAVQPPYGEFLLYIQQKYLGRRSKGQVTAAREKVGRMVLCIVEEAGSVE